MDGHLISIGADAAELDQDLSDRLDAVNEAATPGLTPQRELTASGTP